MAGNMSRNKGAKGEREIIAILQPVVDRVCDQCGQIRLLLKRNYTQRFESKQYDIEGLPWLALEVKRHENLAGLPGWWRQCRTATRPGQTSVLLYRQNNKSWNVRMRVPILVGGGTKITATVNCDLPTFLVYFEHRLKYEIQGRRS